jgi:hypothetical protein
MRLLIILLGLVILVFGRNVFWLFIGIVGFLLGMEVTGIVLSGQPHWVMLAGGLVFGVAGTLLAIFVERVAFAIAGFYAGASMVMILAAPLGVTDHSMALYAIGGVIGAVAAALLMDWAIIGLSCLIGAAVIVNQLPLNETLRAIAFVLLIIIGVSVQARFMGGHVKGTGK